MAQNGIAVPKRILGNVRISPPRGKRLAIKECLPCIDGGAAPFGVRAPTPTRWKSIRRTTAFPEAPDTAGADERGSGSGCWRRREDAEATRAATPELLSDGKSLVGMVAYYQVGSEQSRFQALTKFNQNDPIGAVLMDAC